MDDVDEVILPSQKENEMKNKRIRLKGEVIRQLGVHQLGSVRGAQGYVATDGNCESFEGYCWTDSCYTMQGDGCGTPAAPLA